MLLEPHLILELQLMLHWYYQAVCTRLAVALQMAGIFPTAGTESLKFSINQAELEINLNTNTGGILVSWKSRETCN